jgi:Polyketide cyclase / dehydrase and lipid transport.
MATRESVSGRVDAPPAVVFGLLTDVSRLPEWNRAITDVVETPTRLVSGAEWKVRLHALGQSWVSKSRVSELDPEALRFSYRSQSDDGNASYADWAWQVDPEGDGSMVSVSVDLKPVTFWRKHLLVKIRRPLRSEMRDSLAALRTAIQST